MNHQSAAHINLDYALHVGDCSEQTGHRSGKAGRHMRSKHLLAATEAVQDLLTLYCRHLEREGKSINTINSYCQGIKLFAGFITSHRGRAFQPGHHFTPLNLALFLSYLRRVRGCQESTIRTRMSALTSYVKFLLKNGLLTCNPVLMLRRAFKVRCSARNKRDLNYQRLIRFLRSKKFTPNALRNLLIVALQYQTRISSSELSLLTLADIVWSRRLPKGLIIGKGNGRRLVPLKNKLLIRVLNLYIIIRKLQIGSRLIKGRSGEEQGLSPSSIRRVVKTVWLQAGLGASWSSRQVIHDNICGSQTRTERINPIPGRKAA